MSQTTFKLEVGLLLRQRVKDTLKGECLLRGLSCEIIETKGLLESTLYVKISGESDPVTDMTNLTKDWIKRNQSE